MVLIRAKDTEDAWRKAVSAIYSNGDHLTTEDKDKTKEILGLTVKIANPSMGDKEVPKQYPFKGRALKDYIDQLMTPENHWNFEYTYGERIWNWDGKIDQIQLAIDRISENIHTRRATCDLAIPYKDTVSNDPPCLRIIDFKIREFQTAPMLPPVKKLMMTVLFRSHDIFGASYANWIALGNLQKYVCDKVSKKNGNNIVPGEIHSYSVSAHIYERDFEGAKSVLDETQDR